MTKSKQVNVYRAYFQRVGWVWETQRLDSENIHNPFPTRWGLIWYHLKELVLHLLANPRRAFEDGVRQARQMGAEG